MADDTGDGAAAGGSAMATSEADAHDDGVMIPEQAAAADPGTATATGASRANSVIFKVRDFACFCGLKYAPSM